MLCLSQLNFKLKHIALRVSRRRWCRARSGSTGFRRSFRRRFREATGSTADICLVLARSGALPRLAWLDGSPDLWRAGACRLRRVCSDEQAHSRRHAAARRGGQPPLRRGDAAGAPQAPAPVLCGGGCLPGPPPGVDVDEEGLACAVVSLSLSFFLSLSLSFSLSLSLSFSLSLSLSPSLSLSLSASTASGSSSGSCSTSPSSSVSTSSTDPKTEWDDGSEPPSDCPSSDGGRVTESSNRITAECPPGKSRRPWSSSVATCGRCQRCHTATAEGQKRTSSSTGARKGLP